MRRFWISAALVTGCLLAVGTVAADTTSSDHYKASETHFGTGADLQDCSSTYCAKLSVGDTTVGNSNSTTYFSALFGSGNTDQPLLEVITESGAQNLGVLDTTHTATATRIIKVRSYLSSGYTIQITGNPPTQGTHQLNTISTPSTSHAGAEQFGINMVANTSPNLGSDPVQVPTSSTSYGYAADDYATSNLFKYVNGDIVARSDRSSGETDFTLSMIINVSNNTPAGHYDGSYSAVVVPIY